MFYYVLLFKAKQRFAYLLLIQSVYLFLNVLFLFRSVFYFFKCFCFAIRTIRYRSFIIKELVLSLTFLGIGQSHEIITHKNEREKVNS